MDGLANFSYDPIHEEARTLVHNEERIAMRRFTVEGAGVNYAYAWEEGVELEQMQRIVWYVNEAEEFQGWLKVDANGKVIKTGKSLWTPQGWQDIQVN